MATADTGQASQPTALLPTVAPPLTGTSVLTPIGTPPTPLPTPLPAAPVPTNVVVQANGTSVEPKPMTGTMSDGLPQASANAGSTEPYPAGSSSGSGTSGSRVACNRRIVHIVRSGENLFRIALRYNTTSAAIARLNGITNVRSVRAGQRLTVITCRGGDTSSGYGTYVVQAGDNLFRIALRFGTTVAAIRACNSFDSNLVSNGQVLRIPA